MKRLFVASALALIASQGFAMDSLSDFGWKNRVVLIFGDASDKKFARQLELLQTQKAALKERDMVVISISGNKARTVYSEAGSGETGSGEAGYSDDGDRDAAALRRDAGIAADGFHVVLVGKDGGVKLKSNEVVGDVEMFGLIDSMPMRRAGKG